MGGDQVEEQTMRVNAISYLHLWILLNTLLTYFSSLPSILSKRPEIASPSLLTFDFRSAFISSAEYFTKQKVPPRSPTATRNFCKLMN